MFTNTSKSRFTLLLSELSNDTVTRMV